MDTRPKREIDRVVNVDEQKLKAFFRKLARARFSEEMRKKNFLLYLQTFTSQGKMEFEPTLVDFKRVERALGDTLTLFNKRRKPWDIVLFAVDRK